ncbi:hypothetical protein PA598K_01102 [Paenibacillus sp. 598K]|uniref:hypothetical protein n=1 Tax=Paenibacillus sp. 598K TaxID=1117987 RepID=UPI000FFADB55|nr:hypothetical protein [Paenibacillus sp. 598K]GBF72832.1 hypothetical protein PA598K_01102 [Paenibacillus sp. 598K]
MFTRTTVVALLTSIFLSLVAPAAFAATAKPVQVFDVVAGKVVKTVDNNEEFQRYAKGWLGAVTGLSPQLKPDEKCGYVYRVPLDQPVTVKTGKLEVQTDDVFLFYCPDKPAVLLIFDAQKKPYLLSFQADLQPFLKKIGSPAA